MVGTDVKGVEEVPSAAKTRSLATAIAIRHTVTVKMQDSGVIENV